MPIDLPPPTTHFVSYHKDRLAYRLKLYQYIVDLHSEYYTMCQADGDSDRDLDRAGYGRYGGTTDFEPGTTQPDRFKEVQELKWEATKELGKGIVSAYAGDLEGALQSLAQALELEVEAFKKDADRAIDGVKDFFNRD